MTVRGDLTTCVDDQARRTKMQRTTSFPTPAMISKSAGSAIITLQDRKFVLRERVTLQREYVETRNKN